MKQNSLPQSLEKGRELLLANDFVRAFPLYQKLIRERPSSAGIWFEYGNAAAGLRRLDLAHQAWRKAIELEPRNADLIGVIGHRYQALRQTERARECFAQAATVNPRAIDPRISLAVLLERNHLLDQARAEVEACLAIDPHDDQGRYFEAILDRREGKLETAERRLRDLISSEPRHPYVRYACRYELAQVLDHTARYDEAMTVLQEAKVMVRGLVDTEALIQGYDRNAENTRRFTEAQPKNILQTWAEFFPERKREPIPPLVFLGGHPRSGTTLLERVLDAHPAIAALDEPTAFLDVLQPAFHQSKEHSSARLNVIRKLYLDALLQEIGPSASGKILVDKNPSPTARLPVWLRVFPELRVLIALRDPRDVMVSCYFQNIPLNSVNVNFLSLERLAKHYADLMDVWLTVRQWEGFQWLETRYEDMVANLAKETGRVNSFLGLAWHEEQRLFYEKSRQKQHFSPTYQDVTRPIYTRSVARWRAYEKHLSPILATLEPYCRAFGYE